jgi:hypothetical protein
MYRLQALALQADLTRVVTMMVGRGSSFRAYDQIGIPESHHQLSHHRNDSIALAKLSKIQTFHLGFLVEFIARLHDTKEADATVLARSMIVYGARISDSNLRIHENLLVLDGEGNRRLKSGEHVALQRDTPVTNLHLALIDRMEVRPERLGDSTGALAIYQISSCQGGGFSGGKSGVGAPQQMLGRFRASGESAKKNRPCSTGLPNSAKY